MAIDVQPEKETSFSALTDLPGIGPTKEKWLKEAGIDDIEAMLRVPVEELAHVRGIGYLLARRLKEIFGQPPEVEEAAPVSAETQPVELTEAQVQWQETVSALTQDIEKMIEHLRYAPESNPLKANFVKELRRVGEAVQEIPVREPPLDAGRRAKISKHAKAICALLESAVTAGGTGKNHRKVLRDKIRRRRKKLEKWI